MQKLFTTNGWQDYLYWQSADRKTIKRINTLLADIERHGDRDGIGKPELLRGNFAGYCSRRITDEHRLIYQVRGDVIVVIACRYHYE